MNYKVVLNKSDTSDTFLWPTAYSNCCRRDTARRVLLLRMHKSRQKLAKYHATNEYIDVILFKFSSSACSLLVQIVVLVI